MARPSYRVLRGQVGGYTPAEGYNAVGGYFVQGSNGARTVRTTMPRGLFLGMTKEARSVWLEGARNWVHRELAC